MKKNIVDISVLKALVNINDKNVIEEKNKDFIEASSKEDETFYPKKIILMI
jgi:hypothetical protein